MRDNLPFYIVDVFAEERYAGNQLAVCRGAPDETVMQPIAREMNYSETTFILSEAPENSGYPVRIFTPTSELPFAGHPTLGTAYIIRHEIIGQPVDTVVLNLKVGQIPVTFAEDGVVWMKQNAPTFGREYSGEEVASLLRVDSNELDSRFPVQTVSTGLPFIIVPLKRLGAVAEMKPDLEGMAGFTKKERVTGMLVFCPETESAENQLHVRVFVPGEAIAEDPATGSGNGDLAAYLSSYGYFGSDEINVRVEQGYEMGRPSLLYLRAQQANGSIEVRVGGRVVMVAEGRLVE